MSEQKLLMNVKNRVDALKLVSPQQAKVLEMQAEHADAFDTSAGTYDEMRANYCEERKMWNSGGPVMAESLDIGVPFAGHIVKTRLLRPTMEENLPILFYIHGGGMVVGDNNTHGLVQRKLAMFSGCAVVGIEYTLAPEGQYPLPLEECSAAVRYFTEHAAEYKLDAKRIGLSGDSGGANMSMGCLLHLRDNGFDMSTFRACLLYYGGYGLGDSVSKRLHGGAWDGLTETDFAYYQKMYLGDQDPRDCPYYSAYVNDLSTGIPPCFFVAGDLDPLLDDSLLLYQVLTGFGVPCELREYKGALHAFLHYSKVMDDAEDAIRRGAHFFAHYCGTQP
ncbi:MAG: alpha/beta hydrolase fold domain-containing protein [Pseudoflavonifractor sp.]